ncbi:hypothetical protein [Nocardioides ultimimeridianus]
MRKPTSWLLPADEPILGLLTAQWTTVTSSLEAVAAWTHGTTTTAEIRAVLDVAVDRERDERRALHRRVRSAFWTPLDPEDIYELGERIGMLHRQLELLVSEAEASGTEPDRALGVILASVTAAADPLDAVLRTLPATETVKLADEACDRLEAADDAYRAALRGLRGADVRDETHRRELYRRAEQVTEAAIHVAHRAWYAVCKIG